MHRGSSIEPEARFSAPTASEFRHSAHVSAFRWSGRDRTSKTTLDASVALAEHLARVATEAPTHTTTSLLVVDGGNLLARALFNIKALANRSPEQCVFRLPFLTISQRQFSTFLRTNIGGIVGTLIQVLRAQQFRRLRRGYLSPRTRTLWTFIRLLGLIAGRATLDPGVRR